MEKKKILLIHHSGLIGGAGISLFNLWTALSEKYEVVGYVADDPPALVNFLREKGLSPKTFGFRMGKLPYYSGGNTLWNPKLWYHTIRAYLQKGYFENIINTEKPDLVLVNSKVICWLGPVCKKMDVKSVCFVRETIPGNPNNFMNSLMKNMLESFDIVSFLSEYDLKQTGLQKTVTVVAKDFMIPENYIGIQREDACKKLGLSSDTFNVLFVGGIDKLKGIDVAVKAMKKLRKENVSLIVAGKDFGEFKYSCFKDILDYFKRRQTIKFSSMVKAYINDNSLADSIRFIGVQKDISIAFSASDVLIFPMNKPHQARPAFEIGVQKKPVVISGFSNISEFVKDGYNGLLFEPKSPESLAEAIIKLKNDKVLFRTLGENNYAKAMSEHTLDKTLSVLIDNIYECLNNN